MMKINRVRVLTVLTAMALAAACGVKKAEAEPTPVPVPTATVTWVPPTQNTDGTTLTDLTSYRIYWGTTSGTYPSMLTIPATGTTKVVTDSSLQCNKTYFFVMTAINAQNNESQYSNVASKTMPSCPVIPQTPQNVTLEFTLEQPT